VEVIGIRGLPLIRPGDDLGALLTQAAAAQGTPIEEGDILVVAQKVVSKAEGRVKPLGAVHPSSESVKVARLARKPVRLVELALREARRIVRLTRGHLITETRQGWVYSCSGVDLSNVDGGRSACLLPQDPDASASRLRARIEELTGRRVAIIIVDTSGRPFRRGDVRVAIGAAGLEPLHDYRGNRDLFGYRLRFKQVAVVDELASAAGLVIGEGDEGVPAAIIRGFPYQPSEGKGARLLQRSRDLFLEAASEAAQCRGA
jgi:coenzyme F420-0:L-glutamate ligase/coenzyme F420-1:gamma-L-glutamate ligase